MVGKDADRGGGGDGKRLYEMRGRPFGMPLEDWYEAIYNQWYRRETWCEVNARPLMETLPGRRHYSHFNRSVIRFQTPRKPMVFSLKEGRPRGMPDGMPDPGKRCGSQHPSNYLLAKLF